MDRTTKYAKQVLSDNIIAGLLVKLACRKHMEDIKNSKKKTFEFFFDVDEAERAIDFFGFCKHSKGEWAGKVLELELWQCFIVGSVYGWKHKKTKLRRFKKAYVQVARKNGKSTLMAGIGLYSLLADGEQGAEVYSAATKKDQARIIFDEAKRMVKSSDSIQKYVEVLRNNMNVLTTNSKFEPLSSDENSLDGLNVSCGLIDELHAHKSSGVWDVLDTATSARKQPIIWAITTAGFNRESICYKMYEQCINILKGTSEVHDTFSYIAQIDKDDDWREPSCWTKANPNLNVSVNIDDLLSKCKNAIETPSWQNNFLCKHLNVWTNQSTRWMDPFKWNECPVQEVDLSIKRSCIVGIDASATTDLTSVNFEFELENGMTFMYSHSFMPEDKVLEAEKRDNVPYSTWIKQGYITATPGTTVDYDWIEAYIEDKAKVWSIQEICHDPWNTTQLANNLSNKGFVMVEIRQGYRTLSEPTKDIMRKVLNKTLVHNNNPVLTWAINNVVATTDPAGNIKPDKSKCTFRIDPAMAMIISHVRGMLKPEKKQSVYERRGVRAV